MNTPKFPALLVAVVVILPTVFGTTYSIKIPIKEKGSDALFRVQKGGKWGYIDRQGRVLITPQFDDAGDFFSGLAAVQVGNHWGYVSTLGRFVIQPQYDSASSFRSNLAIVAVGGRAGVIDRTGNFVVSPQYDQIQPYAEGRAAVWVNAKRKQWSKDVTWMYGGSWGFLDEGGALVVKPQFDWVQDFSEGLAAVGVNGKRDAQGDVTTMDGGKWGFIDRDGAMVIRPQFDEVKAFSSGVAAVWSEREKKLGLVDRTGRFVLPFEFSSIEPFYEGFAAVRGPEGSAYITPDGRYAIRDGEWNFGTFYQGFGAFSGGLAPVYQGDSKVGFIDNKGRIQIPIRFNQTWGFSEGLSSCPNGQCLGLYRHPRKVGNSAPFFQCGFLRGRIGVGGDWSLLVIHRLPRLRRV